MGVHPLRTKTRPFRPERLVVWVVVALAIALSLYQWHQSSPPPSPTTQPASPISPPPPRHQAAPRTDHLHIPSAALPEGARAVTKCVVNGTTSYGDASCGQGAKTTQVITRPDHNLLQGMTPEQLAAARKVQIIAPANTPFTTAPTPVVSTASACQTIDAEIIQLDALARQPQSGQMQDWISQQRKALRDQQFRLGCR